LISRRRDRRRHGAGADQGDTTTIQETLPEAAEQLEAAAEVTKRAVAVIEEVRAAIMDRTTCTRLVGCGALTCAAMQTC